MDNLTEEDIQEFVKLWYSQESITWVQRWIDDFNAWNVCSKEQLKELIDNELFVKYKKVNV